MLHEQTSHLHLAVSLGHFEGLKDFISQNSCRQHLESSYYSVVGVEVLKTFSQRRCVQRSLFLFTCCYLFVPVILIIYAFYSETPLNLPAFAQSYSILVCHLIWCFIFFFSLHIFFKSNNVSRQLFWLSAAQSKQLSKTNQKE